MCLTQMQLNPELSKLTSCPVDGSEACEGEFFILGGKDLQRGETVIATDEPLPVEKPGRKDHPEICENWAYSMCIEIEDLRHAQNYGVMTKKCIYKVDLHSSDGMMHHSPSEVMGDSHHDWWPAVGAKVDGTVVQDGKKVPKWR